MIARPVLAIAIGAFVALAIGRDAAAQQDGQAAPTRAEELEAQRRAKAENLQPNRPSAAEAGFLYVEDHRLLARMFDPPAGLFAQVGGLTEGAGFALGAGYRVALGPAGTLDLRGVASIGKAWLADLTWQSDRHMRRRVSFAANAAVERHANQHFYGLGPDSTTTYDSDFNLDERQVTGVMNVRLTRWLSVSTGGGFARLWLSDLKFDFDDEDDDLSMVSAPDDPQVRQYLEGRIPGLTGTAHLGRFDTTVHVDTRAEPSAGGTRVELRQAWYQDTKGAPLDFRITKVDIQHFIPMWNRTRGLAFRAAADRLVAAEGDGVPFYLQPTIGGSRTLRAFDHQRFRDTSTLLLQAEYRYEVNPFLSGAVFAETGQVASDWNHFRRRAFRGDYGLGLRVGYGRSVVLRTDLALGGEGPRLIIALNGMFN